VVSRTLVIRMDSNWSEDLDGAVKEVKQCLKAWLVAYEVKEVEVISVDKFEL
jgi:hypothetical protein